MAKRIPNKEGCGVPKTVGSGTRVLLSAAARNEPFAEQLAATLLERGRG
jgi:hypothetical protein